MRNVLRMLIPVLLVVSVAANMFMYLRWRNRRTYMTINGHNVTQQDIYDYLVQERGPVIKELITERLLTDQEAEKRHLAPTDAEVQDQYNDTLEQNWQFARQIQSNAWLEGESKARIRQQIEQARLLSADVPVTDDQIKEEYNANPIKYDTPGKAHVEMALLRDTRHKEEILALMAKTPPISPTLIAANFQSDVLFLGKDNVFTVFQPYGTQENAQIFSVAPGKVVELPANGFSAQGIKELIVRMIDVVPGKKADLNDPKTHEKLRLAVALKRTSWAEYLKKLWQNADFRSEDPNDKRYLSSLIAPENADDKKKENK